MLSDAGRAELESIAHKTGLTLLLLRIGDGEDTLFRVRGAPRVLEVDVSSQTMTRLTALMTSFDQPGSHEDLLTVARHLNETGVQARKRGRYDVALLCYRFAIAIACAVRDWQGSASLSANILFVRESFRDRLRVNVTPPFPDGPEAATLTRIPYLAGNMIQGGGVSPDQDACLAEGLLELIRDDALSLRASVPAAPAQEQSASEQQNLSLALTRYRLALLAGDVDVRRSLLADVLVQANQQQRYVAALSVLLEDLAQADEYNILIEGDIPWRGYEHRNGNVVPIDDQSRGFRDVWERYCEQRERLPAITEIEPLLWRYESAYRQLQSARWAVTCAGGSTGPRFSYEISRFLQPLGRDYIYLLTKAGRHDTAFALAEELHARSMVDWMARSHHTNRLVRDPRLRGSLNAVMPAGRSEIREIARTHDLTIVSYAETHHGLEVWLHQPNGDLVSAHVDDPLPLIRQLTRSLPYVDPVQDLSVLERGHRHLSSSEELETPSTTIEPLLTSLFQVLFPAPVRAALPPENGRLVIVPDSLLEYVPFCALRTDEGRYLVERFELLYWPSVTAWLLTQSAASIRAATPDLLRSQYDRDRFSGSKPAVPNLHQTTDVFVLGNPDFSTPHTLDYVGRREQIKLKPLPGTETEARAVAQLLDGEPLLGREATVENLLDRVNLARVVHLATHGVATLDNPAKSFVALSGGVLSAEGLYESDRPLLAEMVVLSACQTALGGEHPDSLIGLTNAFLIAGANTVVSTLWQIDDAHTVQLMTRFYEHLKGKQTVSGAMRLAQMAVLQQDNNGHPYYWAAFKVIGSLANPILQA